MSYIEKGPIIKFITKGLNNPDKTKAYGYDAIEILAEIEYTPTADVVEVVRCRDCRYFTEGMAVGMCKRVEDKPIIPCCFDHFCSYGERRKT